MKYLVALAICAGPLLASGSADARQHYRHRHVTTHHFGHYLVGRHLRRHYRHYAARHYAYRRHRRVFSSRGTLPAPCRVAASMGGPCGCWAAYTLLGRLDHVWHGVNLWLADDWLRFPRAAPAPGTAVVWPHRHVAPVVQVHNDRTGKAVAVTTRESWGLRRVSLAGLVVVQPPGKSPSRATLVRYPSGVPL